MKRSNQQSLKEVIEQMLKSSRLSNGLKEYNLKGAWQEIVGDHIAKHTTSIELKNKYLYVEIDSSVLRNELSYGKSLIIKKVNDFLGEEKVEKLVLK